jgi:hypothetical protein
MTAPPGSPPAARPVDARVAVAAAGFATARPLLFTLP